MTWAAAIPALVQAGASIYGATQSGKRSAVNETMLQEQADALRAAQVYEEAALNPASPHAKALRALIEADQRQKVMQAIDALQRNQNRSRARGIMGALVNPERRDESIAGTVADMFAQIGQRSAGEASTRLSSAADSARGRASGYQGPNALLQDYANNRNRSFSDIMGVVGELANQPAFKDALSKMFGGNAPPTTINMASSSPGELTYGGGFKDIFNTAYGG